MYISPWYVPSLAFDGGCHQLSILGYQSTEPCESANINFVITSHLWWIRPEPALLALKRISLVCESTTDIHEVSFEHDTVADLEEGATGACPPPNFFFWLTGFFFAIPFCIRILKNKSQMAWESIKTLRASMALKRALDPGCKGLWASRPWCACTHMIFCRFLFIFVYFLSQPDG